MAENCNNNDGTFFNSCAEWIVYGIFLIPAELIRALSLKNAYRLARFVGFILYHIDWKHRKRIITHLLHSGIVTDRKEARCLAKKNFVHMVKVFVEVVKFDQIINAENHREYISVDPEISQDIINSVNPEQTLQTIVPSMHLGNWELSANCYCYYTKQYVCSIMRPLPNKKIGNYFYRKRNGISHESVSKERGVKPLLTALKKGKTIAIVADQHASHTEGIEHKFFGHPARSHMTPALLHLKTAIPLFPLVLIRKDDEFHFMLTSGGGLIQHTPTGDKEKDIRTVTEAYAAAFEKLIRKYPEQWLWAHRRWLNCGRASQWTPDHFASIKKNQTAENDTVKA
ncbi:MAG: lysophospholipid acyltransferase family protein [Lentisphaeria bacterium]|nr:lysophospholipid acyltransferase family protein [Lentisphaeria bacterium]